MIFENTLISNIRRGVRNRNFKRLRKSEWTNESLKTAITKANSFLKGKYALNGPQIYYDFKVVEKQGRTCMMEKGEYYYYQIIEYKTQHFWGESMNSFIESQGFQSKL